MITGSSPTRRTMRATRKSDSTGLDNLLLIPVLTRIGRKYA